ncbi:uncharacterized protein LOC107769055 [Nicotiana tabacum]|uniref:Uncharacterized protein n=1 Tax=Nicotiana tabacum TaxID=4097 RepID=A0A1S3XV10_TOBAC|nr:PREDICTED: uncharacterized protein LOC107769055 [Nicotiana tabacum]XP_016443715.1 PREDICTED: uncharacterized protein LOC107769055 [Nicotiana tabacum]
MVFPLSKKFPSLPLLRLELKKMRHPPGFKRCMGRKLQTHEATFEISDENSVTETAPAPVNRKRPRGGNAERWLEEDELVLIDILHENMKKHEFNSFIIILQNVGVTLLTSFGLERESAKGIMMSNASNRNIIGLKKIGRISRKYLQDARNMDGTKKLTK